MELAAQEKADRRFDRKTSTKSGIQLAGWDQHDKSGMELAVPDQRKKWH